tara:strand:+ start:68 stop:274 length:207 start_codon:yes stop_codon:yes gene_type:complete
MNNNTFCQRVEALALECGSYIEAVIKTCDEAQIDLKSSVKYLSKPIVEKIQQEGESVNLLPKKSKLPI